MADWQNQLYFGDNLDILRAGHIPVESVDLVYLDPPFNSNATYNLLFAEKTGEKSHAQITAFEDTWHWGDEAAAAYDDVLRHGPPKLAALLQALHAFLGGNDMMAYLAMMAVRLVELHRVLKPSGSLYLHCDPTASHYIRLLLNAIDVWENIPLININAFDKERLGYPTQKPEALLERIIQASSNEGDIVLDPFCGCGTTITVAERLKRRWIGIDITHLAITLIKKRLQDSFGAELAPYEVIGEPADAPSAASLAEMNRHQFEWWALGLVDAAPAQDKKKGADKGVDGIIYFQEKDDGPYKKIIVQVKSGHVGAKEIRELEGTRKHENAEIAALITLKPPTKPMKEAAAADFYVPEDFPETRFSRLQILTIADLFAGKHLEYPRWVPPKTFKRAARRRKGPTDAEKQQDLLK